MTTADPRRPGARPYFNHVALSVPRDLLDEEGRARYLDFFSQVFGWAEMPTMTIDRERLVLQAYTYEQFVYLVGSDEPMRCGSEEHFGMSVATVEELDEMYDRALRYRDEFDDRVEIWAREVEDFDPITLTSFYVKHLTPMRIEVQHYDVPEDARAFFYGDS